MMTQAWGDFGWFGMGFGWLFMILIWGLVLLGIAALVRWLFARPSANAGAERQTAVEILRERYARGEIGRDEYEQKLHDLSQH
jgi:putative membrane protein